MPSLQHFQLADSRDAMLESLRNDGAFVIDSVLASDFVAALRN